MPTNIDTGLTVQDAVHADHSPHIATMSNGDLLVLYYNGTNLVWRAKSGGSWSAATTITLDTGVTPPKLSFWTRNGNVILGAASTDPIDASHNADLFELTYTTGTHSLAITNHSVDNLDGNLQIAGVGYISGATAADRFQELHGAATGGFATLTEWAVDFSTNGIDQVPTFTDFRSAARSGVVTDGATTTYLMYGCASTGTAFKVERFVAGTNGDNVESPTAPAANPAGIAGVYDGTHYTFVINENNAKLRTLTRTGTNTYGSWTTIVSDTGITDEPAVCVKSNGDLAVFYRTTRNFANGEIWVVQRTSGVWGSPALFAGGANTGWRYASCAASDLNDSGNARVVYVTGTASTWTLVEDNYAFTSAVVATPAPFTWPIVTPPGYTFPALFAPPAPAYPTVTPPGFTFPTVDAPTGTTSTRVVPASAALLATNTRAVPASAALLATNTRVVPASAALLQTLTRVVPTSAALVATLTRAVPVSAALIATNTRVVPTSAALIQTLTRQVPASAALIQTLTRVIPASAALVATLTRQVPTSAALLATDARAVPTSAALIATPIRVVPVSAAFIATPTRQVPASAALIATNTRLVPASVALLSTLTRVVPASVQLGSGITRVVPTSAALIATLTRQIPASAALLATATRAVPTSAALVATLTRVVPTSAGLVATLSRVVPASAALVATDTRAVPASAALLQTLLRVAPASVALLWTLTRAVPASATLLGTETRQIPTGAVFFGTATRQVRASVALSSSVVLGTVSGIVFLPNALLLVARGVHTASANATSAPAAYLQNVLAHIEPASAEAYRLLGDAGAALEVEYMITVAAGADIGAGSVITSITALDGVTLWPNESAASNDTWEVVYAAEETALFVPQRTLYVRRVRGQGPTHLTPNAQAPGPAIQRGVVFLPNVLLATARAAYNATSNSTSAPAAYLSGIQAHIEANRASAYTTLPDAALAAPYVANVASGMDIAPSDWVTSITLLDGVTPWPGDTPTTTQQGSGNVLWEVVFIRESPTLFLQQRAVFLRELLGGGVAHR